MLNVRGETFRLEVFCLIFSRCSWETIFVPIFVIFFSMFCLENAFFRLSTCRERTSYTYLSDCTPVSLTAHVCLVLTFFKLECFSFSALDFSMFSRSWGHTSSSSSSASSPTSSSDDRSMVWSPPSRERLPLTMPGADSSPSSKISSRGNGGGSFTKTLAGISFSSWSGEEENLGNIQERCQHYGGFKRSIFESSLGNNRKVWAGALEKCLGNGRETITERMGVLQKNLKDTLQPAWGILGKSSQTEWFPYSRIN